MTTQTEAHDLIRELEDEAQDNPDDYRWKAAAELRRLEADKDDWKDASFVFKERAVKAEARIAELEAANAELLEALRMNAQSLSWLAFGECRGFAEVLPTPLEAIGAARAALKKHGGAA